MSTGGGGLALVRLRANLGPAYLRMVDEFEVAGAGYPYNNFELARQDFAAFVRELADEERGVALPPGIVPQTTHVLVRDGATVLGEIRFRPSTDPPFGVGHDHIGYNVRPSARRRGYATAMLGRVLDEGRNPGSVRTVEKHGGRLAWQTRDAERRQIVSLYWIAL